MTAVLPHVFRKNINLFVQYKSLKGEEMIYTTLDTMVIIYNDVEILYSLKPLSLQ